ncbi:MAG: hypothetical protein A2091_04240 [Desulfuromonadales bacterium GWD2_61_12]|nr:MAG: hypothetical protein A2005_00425 [Desulfuromonadales bacterium GWC2_61_20]OGR32975.1 MAG: hypothetical protein A2091_04240 [Desulfuromonadales bacterium GWD2_61_12]
MQYPKYFKSGQKILMRALAAPAGHFEALTVFYIDHGQGFLELGIPYRAKAGEEYPFAPDMPFELLSDRLGLGLRITCTFKEYCDDGRSIRVAITSDLQIFQRRYHRRLDTNVGLRYTRGQGTLRTFREQWQKNLTILQQGGDPAKIPAFPPCKVNISPGGIRFAINPPVETADLCLLLIQFERTELPVCALAEVVWMGDQEVEGRLTVGMQFINILESDRKNIEKLIEHRARFQQVDEKPKS